MQAANRTRWEVEYVLHLISYLQCQPVTSLAVFLKKTKQRYCVTPEKKKKGFLFFQTLDLIIQRSYLVLFLHRHTVMTWEQILMPSNNHNSCITCYVPHAHMDYIQHTRKGWPRKVSRWNIFSCSMGQLQTVAINEKVILVCQLLQLLMVTGNCLSKFSPLLARSCNEKSWHKTLVRLLHTLLDQTYLMSAGCWHAFFEL